MFDKIVALQTARGLGPLNTMPQGWHQPLPNGWHMVVNGSPGVIEAKIPDFMTVTVEPFTAAFWYNGWYAGAIRPFVDGAGQLGEEGWVAAGDGANEATLIAAMDELINNPVVG